jgi:hypothetical protein
MNIWCTWVCLLPRRLFSFSVSLLLVNRKTIDLYLLILYSATLLKVFTGYKSLLVYSLGSFKYRILTTANGIIWLLHFPFCIHFIYFSCLIALAKNSSTVLNKSQESRQPCLIAEFRRNIFIFSWSVKCRLFYLLYITFTVLKCDPPVLSFFKLLSWSHVEFCQRLYWNDYVIFILDSICFITLIDWHMLNYPCIPGVKPTWSWYMNF